MKLRKEYYKKTLKDLADSGRFIPGIYNYCDRWCERCTKAAKCLVYAQEQEMKDGADPESNDINNEKFWDQIRLSFEVVFEMLQEDAEKWGIDLNHPVDNVAENEPVETPVEKIAHDYGFQMHDWLKNNHEKFSEQARQLLLVKDELAGNFSGAVEVLQWYCFFIAAKVHRAHFDLTNMNDGDDEYDHLGSAKIALIAVERSLSALSALYRALPSQEDKILGFLAKLARIKKELRRTFPRVEEFKRPGFDD